MPQREQAIRTALTGLALYAIGDASALVQFQRAYALGAPGGPVQFLTGAVRATQNRDPDATAAWQSSKDEGFSAVSPFLVDAYLRRGDAARWPQRTSPWDATRTPWHYLMLGCTDAGRCRRTMAAVAGPVPPHRQGWEREPRAEPTRPSPRSG